ncbi:MAG: hypothetical protein RLZZ175_3374 [Bacteroidota bacterium]|jgi:hypothetical protein
MTNKFNIKEIIGKTVSNIYTLINTNVDGLDYVESFIELDNKTIIDIPYGFYDDVWTKKLDKNAISLFTNLSDFPMYKINKDSKTISEITSNYQSQNKQFQ